MNHYNDNQKVIYNPGMGWVMHTSIEQGYQDHNEFEPHPEIQVIALLSSWAKIEVAEGVFDFADLDSAVSKWTLLNKQIHLRISTDPMVYRESALGVPDYVFNTYKVPYQEKEIYGLKAKFPDYRDPVYLKFLHRFVEQIVSRYHTNPQIVLMDLRGYGEWGEWHSGYMHDTVENHVLALRKIIQTWDSACDGRIPLALSASYEWRRDQSLQLFAPNSYAQYLYFSGFDYALTKSKRVTFRRDGIGGALKYYDYELFQAYFKHHHHQPLTTEFFIAYERQKDTIDGVRGYYAEDALEEALSLHPNFMMLMWDSGSFFKERPDLIEHGLKRVGYRLLPKSISIEIASDNIKIVHQWVNHAVGRLYEPHTCHFKIHYTNGKIQFTTDDHVNLHDVIENYPITFTSLLQKDPTAEIESIEIGIYLNQSKKRLIMPLDEQNSNGYVEIKKT